MNRQSTAAVLALAAAALLATGCSTTEPMLAAAQNMLHGGASHFDSTGIITFDANKAPAVVYRENGKVVELPKSGF